MTNPQPQPVVAPLTRAAIFLIVTVNPGDDSRTTVRAFCDDFPGLVRAVTFRDFDDRDVIGFVDGTENPTGQEATDATLIGGEDPGFTGGSYVIVQKYLHDMPAWNGLSTEAQERIIGRSKLSDIELDDAVKP